MWTIILNSDTTLHGTNGYDTQKDVHRFKVKSQKTDRFYETFTIEINDINAKGEAFLNLIWENTMVKIPLKTAFEVVAETPVAKIETVVVKTETMAKTDAHAGHDMPSDAKNTEGGSKPKADGPAGHDMSKMNKNTEGTKKTETMPKMENHAGMNMGVDLKAQFTTVLAAYYGLKDALTTDNGNVAAVQGKALKAALVKIDTKAWTAKQRNAYDAVAKKLETDAEHIGDNAGKIDHQREHFISLSSNILSVTKFLQINSEPAYLLFCPMADGGKGAYWLSKENKVKNPYYGKSMQTCGSVKETIK